MRVVILCGGQGTRLREETEFRPKPLVEVGQRPILWHIMKMYAHFGFPHFVLCLGYRGNMIKEYFLNYEAMSNDFTISLGSQHGLTYHGNHREQDFQVTLVDTGLQSLTGGRVKRVQQYIDQDTFMVAYGDCVADVDLRSLAQYHREHGKLATVTVVRPASRFGILDLDDNRRVARFAEKPLMDCWASAGFFVFSRGVLDYLDGDSCVLEREPLERLTAEGELMAFCHDGFFFAMDTYREYLALNELWDTGKAPWAVWAQ
jgi:glucose-1-phosphate cytidylyltransferase